MDDPPLDVEETGFVWEPLDAEGVGDRVPVGASDADGDCDSVPDTMREGDGDCESVPDTTTFDPVALSKHGQYRSYDTLPLIVVSVVTPSPHVE